jgi:two-component system, OmpR family, sensor histidine kinase CpxA
MHRLFLKIFLWFWLAAVGILAIVVLASRVAGTKQITAPNMYATVASILASESVKAYESGGPEAFARFSQGNGNDPDRQLFLLDGFYKDVLSRPLDDEALRVAHAATSGQLVVLRGHIAAFRYLSPSGRPYILLFFIKTGLLQKADNVFGRGLPFGILMILLVTLLCFWLAYHIAAPIHSIQSTARRVAEGDLKARVPASVSRRYDELAALGKDFDSMVGRLDLLIQTQKNLLNSVSHELRSPLARINLSIALLKRRYSADSDDLLQRLERDVTRIDLLMGQLLTLSRLEAGLSSTDREDVDLCQLIEEVVADADFEAHALEKSVNMDATSPIVIANADPHALRSACENIIRNAVRFTTPGTNVQVVLKSNGSTSAPLVSLYIRDQGPGVPEAALQSIFLPFVRVDRENDISKGNGLGLAIAAEAIRLHRGTISAANLLPTGLEITVRLPLARGPAVSESPMA